MSVFSEMFVMVEGADETVLDRSTLAEMLSHVGVLTGWCAAAQVRFARQVGVIDAEAQAAQAAGGQSAFGFGGSGHSARDRSQPVVDLLTDNGRCSVKNAQVASDRVRVCVLFPLFERALGAGDVSIGHVDALVHAMRNPSEMVRAEFVTHQDDLLIDAKRCRVEMFERICRELARFLTAKADAGSDACELEGQVARSSIRRWLDKTTGMRHTHIELDPLRDAKLESILNAHLGVLRQVDGNRTTPYGQLQVEAFMAAITSGTTGGTTGSGLRVPDISVLIDYDTLLNGLHGNSICETESGVPLPVSIVREMCCDANIIPIVLGGQSEVLDLGRSTRTATKPQRLALRPKHRTCAHPMCEITFNNCRIHHIEWWWEHLGETNLDNLIPICEKHHHQLHQGLWALPPETIARAKAATTKAKATATADSG